MHMCCSNQYMTNMRKTSITQVTAANKAKMPVNGVGDILLESKHKGANGRNITILLTNVLYVPRLTTNFISVSAVTRNGARVFFKGRRCVISNGKGVQLLEGQLSANNIYQLDLQPRASECSSKVSLALKTTINGSISLWYGRLGHLNTAYLKELRHSAIGVQFSEDQFDSCKICVAGKLVNKTFKLNSRRAAAPL